MFQASTSPGCRSNVISVTIASVSLRSVSARSGPARRFRRAIVTVPQRADDERARRVAVLERDEHLVADLRQQIHAPIVAHEPQQRAPAAAVAMRETVRHFGNEVLPV